jgi:hypothetical protein
VYLSRGGLVWGNGTGEVMLNSKPFLENGKYDPKKILWIRDGVREKKPFGFPEILPLTLLTLGLLRRGS